MASWSPLSEAASETSSTIGRAPSPDSPAFLLAFLRVLRWEPLLDIERSDPVDGDEERVSVLVVVATGTVPLVDTSSVDRSESFPSSVVRADGLGGEFGTVLSVSLRGDRGCLLKTTKSSSDSSVAEASGAEQRVGETCQTISSSESSPVDRLEMVDERDLGSSITSKDEVDVAVSVGESKASWVDMVLAMPLLVVHRDI